MSRKAGGWALVQEFRPEKDAEGSWDSPEDAVIVARSQAALAGFAADPRWRTADPFKVRPWTDDYTNLAGSMYTNLKGRFTWLP